MSKENIFSHFSSRAGSRVRCVPRRAAGPPRAGCPGRGCRCDVCAVCPARPARRPTPRRRATPTRTTNILEFTATEPQPSYMPPEAEPIKSGYHSRVAETRVASIGSRAPAAFKPASARAGQTTTARARQPPPAPRIDMPTNGPTTKQAKRRTRARPAQPVRHSREHGRPILHPALSRARVLEARPESRLSHSLPLSGEIL